MKQSEEYCKKLELKGVFKKMYHKNIHLKCNFKVMAK